MRRIRTGLILSVGVAVASCGGSSTEPEDLLTGAEALALFEVAMSQGLQLTDELEPGSETLTPDGAVLQFTVPCTMGETVGVTARLGPAGEPDVDGASVGVSMTLVHSGCIERHETSGITFTLDGAPDLEMSIELSISTEFMLGISGAMDGTVRRRRPQGAMRARRGDRDGERSIRVAHHHSRWASERRRHHGVDPRSRTGLWLAHRTGTGQPNASPGSGSFTGTPASRPAPTIGVRGL